MKSDVPGYVIVFIFSFVLGAVSMPVYQALRNAPPVAAVSAQEDQEDDEDMGDDDEIPPPFGRSICGAKLLDQLPKPGTPRQSNCIPDTLPAPHETPPSHPGSSADQLLHQQIHRTSIPRIQ